MNSDFNIYFIKILRNLYKLHIKELRCGTPNIAPTVLLTCIWLTVNVFHKTQGLKMDCIFIFYSDINTFWELLESLKLCICHV